MGVELGGRACLDPAQAFAECQRHGLPTPWLGLANSFRCPRGQTAGYGVVLMLRRDLDALGLNTVRDLVFTDGEIGDSKTVTLKNLQIVRARAFSPGMRDDENCGYWVELADRRRRAKATVIDKAYNVRSAPGTEDHFSATLNAGSPWTWTQMVSDIWSAVGTSLLGTYPGLPFTPHGTPIGFSHYGWYAYDALGHVLERIGCALNLDPITDTFSIVRQSITDTTATTALAGVDDVRIFDGEPLDSRAALIPQTCRVLFPKSRAGADLTGASPWYISDQTDPSGTLAGVQSGTYAIVVDDLPARYDAGGSLQNASDLANRAAERAADFFRRARHERKMRTYSGVRQAAGLRPGSQIALTCWYDIGGGFKTEILSVPGVPQPCLVEKSGAGGDNCCEGLAGSPDDPWESGNLDMWIVDNSSDVLIYQLQLLLQFFVNLYYIVSGGSPTGITYVSWTGTVNNYALPAGTRWLVVTLTGNTTLTGITGGAEGRPLGVILYTGSFTLTLAHENASSTAANRLAMTKSADNVFANGVQGIELVYSSNAGAINRWLVRDDRLVVEGVSARELDFNDDDFDVSHSAGVMTVTAGRLTDTIEYVSAVSCVDGDLSVTTRTMTFTRGLLVSDA